METITGLTVLIRPPMHNDRTAKFHLAHPEQRGSYACGADSRHARPATEADITPDPRWCGGCLNVARIRERDGVTA